MPNQGRRIGRQSGGGVGLGTSETLQAVFGVEQSRGSTVRGREGILGGKFSGATNKSPRVRCWLGKSHWIPTG